VDHYDEFVSLPAIVDASMDSYGEINGGTATSATPGGALTIQWDTITAQSPPDAETPG
jgi:hypothetical protein